MRILTSILFIAVLFYAVLAKPELSSQVTVFEYKFDYNTSEKKANELGAQGWELVAVQSTGPGLANNVPTYVFKRVKK